MQYQMAISRYAILLSAKLLLDMNIETLYYGKMKLRQRIYLVFELKFIDFLLKKLVEQNNE
jgi:hypothetical protein